MYDRIEDSLVYEESMSSWGLENPIASGMTTCVFEYKHGVQCVSNDKVKLAYMQAANLPEFELVLMGETSFLYTMEKLLPLTEEEKEKIEESMEEFYFSIGSEDLTFDKESNEYKKIVTLFGEGMANGLCSVYKSFKQKQIYLDIHENQFMKDKNGEIFCVDAVMDKKIYNYIQETN